MKKYILAIAALMLITGISNAQVEKKQSPGNTAHINVKSEKQVTAKTAAVTPSKAPAQTQSSSAMAIKRKHNHKKTTSPKKTEGK